MAAAGEARGGSCLPDGPFLGLFSRFLRTWRQKAHRVVIEVEGDGCTPPTLPGDHSVRLGVGGRTRRPRSSPPPTKMRRSARLAAANATRGGTTSPLPRVRDVKKQRVVGGSPAALPPPPGQLHTKNGAHGPPAIASEPPWTPLCSARELSCALTLASGQVFSWRRHPHEPDTWVGVVGRRVFELRERHDVVHFRCLHPVNLAAKQAVDELSHYFRLDMHAEELYARWTKPNDRMTQVMSRLRGLRIIRQEPVECLFSFICSSNNNISRIQGMLDKLKAAYGDALFEYPAEESAKTSPTCFYAFPSLETLASTCEEAKLRELGFGYRAPFIVKTAKQLQQLGGAAYLHNIRDTDCVQVNMESKVKLETEQESYDAYQEKLMVFAGVGRKVADCVALFSLEKLEAIPVDTHVWQIACRELDASLNGLKSLTPRVYHAVGELFRKRFSPQAGWAHSVLFAGDLTAFQDKLPDAIRKPKAKSAGKSKKPSEATEKPIVNAP